MVWAATDVRGGQGTAWYRVIAVVVAALLQVAYEGTLEREKLCIIVVKT